MRFARASLIAIFISAVMAAIPARAGEVGSKEEAIAIVKRVQDRFARTGPDATFKAITEKDPAFIDRDLYPFVYKLDGTNVAHGANAALVGKNLIDLKDQSGKPLIRELIAAGTSPAGNGWIDYLWPNPQTNKIDQKSSYVEKMGDYVVGVGIYRQ
ncbi:MAG: cache domain-containing protein [Afipia sp.]